MGGHFMASNNYTVVSEDFVKITQDFFGAYVRGEGVVDDASIQNGKYIHVVNEVKAVDLSELDMVRKRCELFSEFDDDVFDSHAFCYGFGAYDAEEEVSDDTEPSSCDGDQDKCEL